MPGKNTFASLTRLLCLGLIVVSVGACDLRIVAGSEPDLAALDGQLIAGKSSESEIVMAIGQPFGRGRAMFPFHEAPRDVLAYYFERGSMEDDRRTFLWVFVKEGRYDGHMWFSSLPDV